MTADIGFRSTLRYISFTKRAAEKNFGTGYNTHRANALVSFTSVPKPELELTGRRLDHVWCERHLPVLTSADRTEIQSRLDRGFPLTGRPRLITPAGQKADRWDAATQWLLCTLTALAAVLAAYTVFHADDPLFVVMLGLASVAEMLATVAALEALDKRDVRQRSWKTLVLAAAPTQPDAVQSAKLTRKGVTAVRRIRASRAYREGALDEAGVDVDAAEVSLFDRYLQYDDLQRELAALPQMDMQARAAFT